MKKVLKRLTLYFETVPDQLRRIKWIVWALFVGITVFLTFGIFRVSFDMTLESWFSDDDPAKKALTQFRKEFGSDDSVFIVYRAKDGDVFSENSLKVVHAIREEILSFRSRLKTGEYSMLEHINKVDTIVSANILEVKTDALISKKFIGNDIPSDLKSREILRKKALKEKQFPLLYFSKDYQYGGILIRTDFGTIPIGESASYNKLEEQTDDFEIEMEDNISTGVDFKENAYDIKYKPVDVKEYTGLMEEIEKIIYQDKYSSQLEYFPVGNAPMMRVMMELMSETGPLLLAMIFTMAILLWILFRSLSSVIWPILIVVFSSIWTVGILGWAGVTITNMITLTILFILAVGMAYAVHILSGYLFFTAKGQNHQQAIRSAFRKSALPCLLTSVTTMVGMLAVTITPIYHIAIFGIGSAIGVMLAFLFTVYLLPLLMDIWPPVDNAGKQIKASRFAIIRAIVFLPNKFNRLIPNIPAILQRALNQVLPWVQKSPGTFIVIFMSIFLICIYGATQVKIDTNMIESTRENSILRKIYKVVDKHMMGTQNLEIFIDIGEEDALKDPDVLKAMDQLQQKIKEDYPQFVIRTHSLVDIVKDSYQVLNEDRPEMYKIPDNPQVLSQTLFLFNNANPDDRRRLVSDDYSRSHISVQLHNAGSYLYNGFFNRVQADMDQIFKPLHSRYPMIRTSVTGSLALMMKLTDYISWAQARSLALAIGIISIILFFLFGSMRIGILSIVPNLLPATLTFGLLGIFGIPLDSDTLIIAPVIIGIAVDDTIHFITHYQREVIESGDVVDALKKTINEVGQAITFTSLILGFGFFIMSFSSYMSMVKTGIFGSIAIFVALLCDLFLLPALILIFKPKFAQKSSHVFVGKSA